MKPLIPVLLLALISINKSKAQTFYKGGDLSFVKELEGCGVQWKENNTVKDVFQIFRDNGANIARFRIWHTPTSGKNGYTDTESLIARAKDKGLKILLDFHYSDTWTDPSKQKCPAAWLGVVNNYTTLADSLYNYTKKVLQTLKNKGLMPEFVQVGNETNGGMCFAGDGTVTWPTDWAKQTLLFNAGIKAVRDVDPAIKIILHVADPKNAEWWAGQLNMNNVTGYDILGVSFYPIWHTTKTINDFGSIITNIKNTYQKEVMVVETGLPWSNSWDDNTTNAMNGAPAGYGSAPTPEIQAQWLIDLCNKLLAAGGIGVVYWEPAWVASHSANCPSDFGGSTWENIALFDFNNNLMANGGIKFCQLATSVEHIKPTLQALHVFPNPAMSDLHVQFNATSASEVLIKIIDIQGRTVQTFTEGAHAGDNHFVLNMDLPSINTGMYILNLASKDVLLNKDFIVNK